MKRPVPFGFWVAGACSAWFCVAMVAVVCFADQGPGDWWMTVGRDAASLLAVLAAVVTEALWRARPWVWRASLALALAFAATGVVAFGAGGGSDLADALGVLLTCAVVIVPLLVYIRNRSKALFGHPLPSHAAPVAVPRPSPPPAGPAPHPGGRP